MMGYVVAFNRDRDFYQVPLALMESDLLSGLVTDLYYPDLHWLSRLPCMRRLSHRRIDGLRSSEVRWNLPAIAWQVLGRQLKLNPQYIYRRTDSALARGALHLARKNNAHLFLYSGYALEAFAALDSMKRVKGLFCYHPHPLLNRKILQDDFAQYPECKWSYVHEADTGTPKYLSARLDGEIERADFIVAASSFTKKSLIQAGYDDGRIHVVPYGIAVPPEPAQLETKQGDRCRFLFVGQGVQRKGLHHLLRAWRAITAPDAELTLVCATLDPGIAALADDRVKILSRQSAEDLRQHFARSHVFVMPSLIEGFGFVYGEALANGVYVIGTQNTGLPDLALPDWAAKVIQPGDIEALAEALDHALNDWRAGKLDASAIRTFASTLTWREFRSGVGEIAHRYHV
jgi:glycosyltransferase involved in cell wall biosynthesis